MCRPADYEPVHDAFTCSTMTTRWTGASDTKDDAVKRTFEPHERDMPNPSGEPPTNAGADDSDIDRILADSFPASDAPPWTLGVSQAPSKNSVTRKKNRGNR